MHSQGPGILVGVGGEVLHLGHTHRLATRAQRRALKVRDMGVCQFPGCSSTTHFDAHHILAAHAGAGFSLDECVLVLFDITVEQLVPAAA